MPPQNEATTPIDKSKKPLSDSAYKQQRLSSLNLKLTAATGLPPFFIIGITFILVGFDLLYVSDQIREHIIDYTNCIQVGTLNTTCAEVIRNDPYANCVCNIDFTLNQDFFGKVYMYYGLSNYYQNHRRYVKSRDNDQLLGRLYEKPTNDCCPFKRDPQYMLPIAPCGAIANSFFNDTLQILKQGTSLFIPLNRTGIAWPSDKKTQFRNPEVGLQEALEGFSKPSAWRNNLWELDAEDPENNGFENEDLIVWMRTAALPSFRKLHRRVDTEDGLTKGNYTLVVTYSYPVSAFNGTKKMILTTTSILGGKNPFLGTAYIVVGCVCLLLGIILLFCYLIRNKRYKIPVQLIAMLNYGTPRTPHT